MQRSDAAHNQGTRFGERLVSAFVAVLFFAPRARFAVVGMQHRHWLSARGGLVIPARLLWWVLGASAMLGFVAPRATPTLFGRAAEALTLLGRPFWRW